MKGPWPYSSQASHRDACLSLPALLSRGQTGRLVLPMLCCSGAPRRSRLHPLPTRAPWHGNMKMLGTNARRKGWPALATVETPDTRPCHVRDAHHLRLRTPTFAGPHAIPSRASVLGSGTYSSKRPHHGASWRQRAEFVNHSPSAKHQPSGAFITNALALSRLELRVTIS